MIDRGFLGLLISRHKRLKTEMGKWGGGESSLAKVFKREYEANCRFAGVMG